MYAQLLLYGFLLITSTHNVRSDGDGHGESLSQTSMSRPKELIILTVATDANHDGYAQFMESAELHGLKVETIGVGEEWRGGDIAQKPGGGQKINLMKAAVEKYKERDDLALLFTDSYDVLMTADATTILDAFMQFRAPVVFAAEVYCWPKPELASDYPPVRTDESRYLNSGGYIGYASAIYKLLTDHNVNDDDDDQLYFTNLFLDEYKSKLKGGNKYSAGESTLLPYEAVELMTIKLDRRSTLFQCLNGQLDQTEVKFKGTKSYMFNHATGSIPLVIHGNGPIKHKLNRLSSYLNGAWTPSNGCQACSRNRIKISDLKELPVIFSTFMVEQSTPFLDHWLDRVANLSYPKDRMDVFMHSQKAFHDAAVQTFADKYGSKYRSFQLIKSDEKLNGAQAKNLAMKNCLEMKCEYLLAIDSLAQVTNPDTVQELLSLNKSLITPMMIRPDSLFSSMWTDYNENSYYATGPDYKDIVSKNYVGVWNVPYVASMYLVKASKLALLPSEPFSAGAMFPPEDYDVAFAYNCRKSGLFMHVTNLDYYGHLINPDDYDVSRTAPDLAEIFNNKKDWEQKYLHANFFDVSVNETYKLEEPCTDVYWFPMVSVAFCDDLVNTMETFGKWSGGSNQDERLAGGYENVPTRDIHMNQVGLEKMWIQVLRDYVYPVQLKLYPGYYSTLNAIMNFVVRYRPDEQPSLRPHHDSATFTINMALNTRNVDYEGGGVKFLRYNCTLVDLRKGWSLIHPGRLTHQHEGLATTKGTRYIMVSFVNP